MGRPAGDGGLARPDGAPGQNNSKLRDLLLECSFEAALGKAQSEPFTPADRQALEQALLEAFIAMDREIARPDHAPHVNIHKVQDLLFRFWGQRGQRVNAGYMFTLNQDLWPSGISTIST